MSQQPKDEHREMTEEHGDRLEQLELETKGIVVASKARKSPTPPIVARMLGTNADEGRKILKEAKIGVHLVNDFTEATKTIKSLS